MDCVYNCGLTACVACRQCRLMVSKWFEVTEAVLPFLKLYTKSECLVCKANLGGAVLREKEHLQSTAGS